MSLDNVQCFQSIENDRIYFNLNETYLTQSAVDSGTNLIQFILKTKIELQNLIYISNFGAFLLFFDQIFIHFRKNTYNIWNLYAK